jgi:hypothetical protein
MSAPLGRIRWRTALACSALTVAVVLVRGGARRRRFVFRHHEHRVIAAMNTWAAVSRSLGLVSVERRTEIRVMHMTLSISALAVIVLHILTLLGASALEPRLDRLVIPWLWPYHRTATALGVLSIYMLALLGPTYYARRRLRVQRWRIAHRFIATGLALAILHVVGGG